MVDTTFTDSYITTDAALEALIGDDPRASAIALKALAAASQAWYCQEATRHIDSQPIRGYKYEYNQDQEFPRIIDETVVGDADQFAVVPDAIQRACLEEAIAIYSSIASGSGRRELQEAGVQSFSIGGKLQETFRAGAGTEGLLSSVARRLLRRYIGVVTR